MYFSVSKCVDIPKTFWPPNPGNPVSVCPSMAGPSVHDIASCRELCGAMEKIATPGVVIEVLRERT